MANFSDYTALGLGELYARLRTRAEGLTADEVARQSANSGPNELRGAQFRTGKILLRQFKSSFVYLLLGAAALSFALGESIDSLMIVLFVIINTALGFYQAYRSEKTLRLLSRYIHSRARVIRNRKEEIINAEGLVLGDVVRVETGDIIPADLRFTALDQITVNESVLTGESVNVEKTFTPLPQAVSEPHKACNIGFSGTTVVSGWGEGVVIATGKDSAIGEINTLSNSTVRASGFEKGISRFSRFILHLVILTLVFIYLANLLIKGGSADQLSLLVFSVALAVSVIPEALPVVMTFSLARGASRLSKNKVVVKRLSAIEDLGSIEVLCTDKTGTLTENKLRVEEVYPQGHNSVLLAAALAAERTKNGFTDPFDAAIFAALAPFQKQSLAKSRIIEAIPFDPHARRNGCVLSTGGGNKLVLRGALEALLPLCSGLALGQREKVTAWARSKGRFGMRVLAVAERNLRGRGYSEKVAQQLKFIGAVAFVDPIKPTAQSAVKQARELSVAVKILTGDSAEVAGYVAVKTGLASSPDELLTGEEFERLPASKQREVVEKYSVFARVSPRQKHQIIRLLEEKKQVGFLGEGINDAPALAAAEVGIVVDTAADVAREAADIVLLKKSLNVIIDGIREGREVFANTTKYVKATMASNFGNFYAIAVGSLLVDFLPMLPLQILLLNLLSDFPMIAIATDTIDRDELQRPRTYNIKEIALLTTVLGVVSTFFDFLFFGIFRNMGAQVLQTNWFIGSILTELVFVFSIRTRFFALNALKPSKLILYLTCFAAVATVLLPFTEFGQSVFRFRPPTGGQLALIFGIVLLYFGVTEAVKLLYYRFAEKHA